MSANDPKRTLGSLNQFQANRYDALHWGRKCDDAISLLWWAVQYQLCLLGRAPRIRSDRDALGY